MAGRTLKFCGKVKYNMNCEDLSEDGKTCLRPLLHCEYQQVDSAEDFVIAARCGKEKP